MADTKLILWIGLFVLAYIVARIFFHRQAHKESDYEKDLKKILVSDKYKVKGRYD